MIDIFIWWGLIYRNSWSQMYAHAFVLFNFDVTHIPQGYFGYCKVSVANLNKNDVKRWNTLGCLDQYTRSVESETV